ncbi:MAG: hypothetical protein AAF566_08325 [Pseudomonadota bacterium]
MSLEESGPNIENLTIEGDVVRPMGRVEIQAEDALSAGGAATAGFGSDDGYFLDFVDARDVSLTWTIESNGPGEVDLEIRYALGAAASRTMAVEVNGALVNGAVTFASTGS